VRVYTHNVVVRNLPSVSALLVVALLALTSQGVLCALPCGTDVAAQGKDASATAGHCQSGVTGIPADLRVAPAAGSCADHSGTELLSERASTRSSNHASAAQPADFSTYGAGSGDAAPVTLARREGSPPPLIAPLRI
jgi:hypothetical protein